MGIKGSKRGRKNVSSLEDVVEGLRLSVADMEQRIKDQMTEIQEFRQALRLNGEQLFQIQSQWCELSKELLSQKQITGKLQEGCLLLPLLDGKWNFSNSTQGQAHLEDPPKPRLKEESSLSRQTDGQNRVGIEGGITQSREHVKCCSPSSIRLDLEVRVVDDSSTTSHDELFTQKQERKSPVSSSESTSIRPEPAGHLVKVIPGESAKGIKNVAKSTFQDKSMNVNATDSVPPQKNCDSKGDTHQKSEKGKHRLDSPGSTKRIDHSKAHSKNISSSPSSPKKIQPERLPSPDRNTFDSSECYPIIHDYIDRGEKGKRGPVLKDSRNNTSKNSSRHKNQSQKNNKQCSDRSDTMNATGGTDVADNPSKGNASTIKAFRVKKRH